MYTMPMARARAEDAMPRLWVEEGETRLAAEQARALFDQLDSLGFEMDLAA